MKVKKVLDILKLNCLLLYLFLFNSLSLKTHFLVYYTSDRQIIQENLGDPDRQIIQENLGDQGTIRQVMQELI